MDSSKYTSKTTGWTRHVKALYSSLSPERVIVLWGLVAISIVLFFSALISFNEKFLISTPTYGGEIREGIIGTPRFINPVFATTEQDKDLAALIFAGLTKKDSSGYITLDMAESVTKDGDGLRYEVIIKEGATFHNGLPVTTDDIIYTISLIQNPNLKSPYAIKWEGVTMEKVSDKNIVFYLKRPYPLFMEALTMGVLPKQVWKDLTDEQISLSDYNINAVGSGPYKIKDVRSVSGIPDTLTLIAHEKYTLGRPYVDKITISTFQNERYLLQAFENGSIDRIHNISAKSISEIQVATSSIHTTILPRTFTIFFNPNKANILSDKNIRSALQVAIDKNKIVNEVLNGYGKVVSDPYPFDENPSESIYNIEQARELLVNNLPSEESASTTITVTLTTANTEEMRRVAEMIKSDWEKIGIETNIQIYEVSDLNQSIIRERNFEILLFGFITESPSDLYAFWHSSQRNYPGLNISSYVSNNLDSNLETLRSSDDPTARAVAYEAVKQEFIEEVPGIFLFAPALIYIAKDKVQATMPEYSLDSSSRFNLIQSWYRYTDKVWPKTYNKLLIEKIENIIH